MNINELKAHLPSGGARNTLFRVDITLPPGVDQDAARELPFLAKASSLPSSQIGNIPVPYMGRKINVAGDRTFEPWDITIINDENFKIRHAFEQWLFQINTIQSNISLPTAATPTLYKRDATITQLSKTNTILRVYQFSGVFPLVVSPIEVAWGNNDVIEEFQVRLAYDYHEIVDGPTGTIQG